MISENNISKKERVVVYVDGFNLYFGLMEGGYSNYKWFDLNKLAHNILRINQKIIEIKYFTSRVSNDPDKQKRQATYIEALESVNIKIYYGNYQSDRTRCRQCGNVWPTFHEKMTDVNIATQMLIDAFQDRYDMAMLISGDSDLVPPIRAIHELFESKRIFVAFPPKRHNSSVALTARGLLQLEEKNYQKVSLVMK